MFDLGAGELLLIVFVVLILFGPKKLPELAQSLGRGMREFKRAQREFTEQINQAVSDEHYGRQRGPELRSPEGAVSRGSSRRSVNDERDDRTDESPRGETGAGETPGAGAPAPPPHDTPDTPATPQA